MRILVISNLFPPDMIGGYEVGCSQIVEALQGRGHQVEVLTAAPRRPLPSVAHVRRDLKLTDVYNAECMNRSHPVTQRLVEAEAKYLSPYNINRLTTTLDDFQPDVVYLWNLVGIGGLGLVASLHHLRYPWVWHLMDPIPKILCSLGGNPIPTLVQEFTRQFHGHYLACSQRIVDEIVDGGVDIHGQVELVPNWVRGTPTSRTSYFDGGHLRIVSAGQISEWKGVSKIIEGAAMLHRKGYANFSIDLYGEVTDPWFPQAIRRLGVEGCVTLKGFRPPGEVGSLYDNYDVFAFPTWSREPFAFAPLEAAARGCVPVMTANCGNSEWFVDDIHCLKAEGTAGGFAGKITEILEGRVDLGAVSRRAMSVIWRDFHIDTVITRVEAALEKASGQSRAGAGTASEAYHMAVIAEKLLFVHLQESM